MPNPKYFLMTGDRVSAEEAERLATGPARAIAASKVPINKYLKMVSNLVLPLSLSLAGVTMATADAREAAQAFREKREPKFTGR